MTTQHSDATTRPGFDPIVEAIKLLARHGRAIREAAEQTATAGSGPGRAMDEPQHAAAARLLAAVTAARLADCEETTGKPGGA